MGKSGGTTKTTSSTGLPAFQQPYVTQMLQQAQGLYQQPGPSLYPQQWTSPLTADEVAAAGGARSTAVPAQLGVAQQAQDTFNYNLNEGRNPLSNPFLADTVSAAVNPIFDNLMRRTLPQLRQGHMLAGNFGGSKESIGAGLATSDATRQAFDASTSIYNNAWNQGQALAGQTLAQAPMVQGLWTNPYEVLSGIGGQERAYNQALLDEQKTKYEYEQNLPFTKLAEYSNLIRQPFGAEGTSAVESPTASTASQIAGGVLTVPMLISALRGLFGGG